MERKDAFSQDVTNSCSNEPLIDSLTKAIARGASRRTVLKMMAGGFATMLGFGLAGCAEPNTQTKPTYVNGKNGSDEITACPSCGSCTHCMHDPATDSANCSACAEECYTNQICALANRDANYRKITNYLSDQGYQAQTIINQATGVAPATALAVDTMIFEGSEGKRPVTRLLYTHQQQSAQRAVMMHGEFGGNHTPSMAMRYNGDAFVDVVYVDKSGQIQTFQPEITVAPFPTPTPTVSPTPSGGALLSGSSLDASPFGFTAPAVADDFSSTICNLSCEVIANVPKGDCLLVTAPICAALIEIPPLAAACGVAALLLCQKFGDITKGPLQNWCQQNLCCAFACENNCEVCSNGQCVSSCGADEVCCHSTGSCMPAGECTCVKCPCTDIIYTSAAQCQDECGASLACLRSCVSSPCA